MMIRKLLRAIITRKKEHLNIVKADGEKLVKARKS